MGLGPLDIQAGDLICAFGAVATPMLALRKMDPQHGL
jgi:hypothetical protein